MSNLSRPPRRAADPIRDATVSALKRILDPLLELAFDAGLTVQEFNKIARDRAVGIAMKRVAGDGGRASKSRIAIMTGLPRAEVSKIQTSLGSATSAAADRHPARRVLAAWHDDPRFSSANGEPAILPIFGKKLSFERLVARRGGGLPVRAMLDELEQLGAVEILDDQRVRAKARVPITTGLTERSITAVGERSRDLLETLAHNLRHSAQPLFEATAVVDDGDPGMVPVIRREITEQGRSFINAATSLLARSPTKHGLKTTAATKVCRLGVTVYYFQDEMPDGGITALPARRGPRKNLRRRPRPSKPEESK